MIKFKEILKEVILEQEWASEGGWDMTGLVPVKIKSDNKTPVSDISSDVKVNASGSAKKVIDFFVSKGLKPHQAAGIAANFESESNFNPGAVGDNGTSIGLAQWHDTRATDLKSWASKNNKKWNDFNTQLEYTWYTLTEKYTKVLNQIKNSKNSDESTMYFMLGYEKPSDQSKDAIKKRQNIAKKYVNSEEKETDSNVDLKSYFSKPLVTMVEPSGNQRWGTRRPYGPHTGIDIQAPVGSPIFSIMDGEITKVHSKGRCGNGLTITNGGWSYSFCHAKKLLKSGGSVKAGEKIAEVGMTGSSSGPHLHFTIKYNNIPLDPTQFFF
jgi:hypothetical protein